MLSRLKLTNLSGISHNTEERLRKGGITTPLQMRHTSPENLKAIFKSVLGFYWHCRLNFIEVDLQTHNDYKSMQAMRHLSKDQRLNYESITEIVVALCLALERRMMKRNTFANTLGFGIRYANSDRWDDYINLSMPIQDGAEIYKAIMERVEDFEKKYPGEPVIHPGIISVNIYVSHFMDHTMVQYNLFEDNSKKDHLRKVVYDLKNKFGKQKLMRAVELKDGETMQDVIGFGSVKDFYSDEKIEFIET